MSWLESETAVISCVSGAGQLGVTEDVDRLQKIPLCVIPAKAGIQTVVARSCLSWIPARASPGRNDGE